MSQELLSNGTRAMLVAPASKDAAIEAARESLLESLERLSEEVSRISDWREHVRRHPFALLGTALALGALTGIIVLPRRQRSGRRFW